MGTASSKRRKKRRGRAIASAVVGNTAIRDTTLMHTSEIADAAKQGLFDAVAKFGRAGTGARIAELDGAARTNATLARIGFGPKANGGLGIDGGSRVLTGVRVVATVGALALVATSIVVKARADALADMAAEAETTEGAPADS